MPSDNLVEACWVGHRLASLVKAVIEGDGFAGSRCAGVVTVRRGIGGRALMCSLQR